MSEKLAEKFEELMGELGDVVEKLDAFFDDIPNEMIRERADAYWLGYLKGMVEGNGGFVINPSDTLEELEEEEEEEEDDDDE